MAKENPPFIDGFLIWTLHLFQGFSIAKVK